MMDGRLQMNDLISRQAAIDAIRNLPTAGSRPFVSYEAVIKTIIYLPFSQPEPLTDNEQRIFLAAMEREMKVCEEVDSNFVREPYEDSLVSICREIKRKVKDALWT